MAQQSRRPNREFRAGSVTASIWSEQVEHEGRTVTRHNTRIEKRYYDKKAEEWKSSEYYFPDELHHLETVVRKAIEFTTLRESGDTGDAPENTSS